ncbi:gliding motility lipoprotein GldH [Psychroserpens damuponensis]|uniref:gliding motility lipoprotein GldH n=1 Tax=Psychroserpens damuponensis TaxID=943936 RepID=UPI00058F5C07|nr:gliding motility lipoprotein GldH [Psychroserpens damuponensis]
MQKSKYWIGCILIVLSFLSCDSNRVFDEYQSVSGAWDKDQIIAFKMSPPDTTNAYNLYVNLRNTEDYKYSNLFLIVELNYPNGKAIKDTLTYKMANPDGTFLGTGFTDVKENKLWYKGYDEPFVFDEPGEYTVNIQQAMRENGSINGIDKLEGITDVGFRIEHSQTN